MDGSHQRTESSELAKRSKDKQPDDDRCGAKTKSGRPCRHPKGFRTDHPGSGRCYRHGGASPNGNKAAVREQMASLATEVDIEPQEVLLNSIRRDWGAVQWCGNIIGQLEYTVAQARESGDMESVVVLEKRLLGFQAVYGEWIDRSAKHAKLALDAGVEERKVRIAEAQGKLLAGVIKAILGDLGLNKKQQTDAPAIVRRHLLALAG
jgi:hypothetical protein